MFETLLFAYFFQNNPQDNVAGNGVATLQWGNVDNTDRHLQQQPYSHDDDNVNRIYDDEDEEIRWLQQRSSSKVIQVPIFAILAEDESDYRERYGSISSSKSSTRTGSIIIISLLVIFGVCLILFGLLQYSRCHRRCLCWKQCITIESSKKIILSEGL